MEFIGFNVGTYWLFPSLLPRMIIYVEEWAGYVTQDGLFGGMVVYGPGYHPSHIWEERNAGRNQSLQAITAPYEVEVQTTSGPIKIKGEAQYAATLSGLNRFIGADRAAIENGLKGFISVFHMNRFAGGTIEAALASVEGTNEALQQHFMGTEVRDRRTGLARSVTHFEHTFGLVITNVFVNHLDLPQEVERARSAIAEAETINGVIAGLFGWTKEVLAEKIRNGDISQTQFRQYLDRAMAMGENATMAIQVIDIDEAAARAFGVAMSAGARFFGGQNQGGTR